VWVGGGGLPAVLGVIETLFVQRRGIGALGHWGIRALSTRYTTVYLSAIHKRAKRNERSVAEFSGYLVSKLI
jgi:hypothetical protein